MTPRMRYHVETRLVGEDWTRRASFTDAREADLARMALVILGAVVGEVRVIREGALAIVPSPTVLGHHDTTYAADADCATQESSVL